MDYLKSARWDLCYYWTYHRKPVGFILLLFQFKCEFQVSMCRWVNYKEVVVLLFPCALSILFYESLSLIIYCLLGGIGVLSAFDTLWHSGLLPSMHCFLACASQRKQLVGAPSLYAWWHHMVILGSRNWRVSSRKGVWMCFLTFTKSSSGLSGCQCCMIYVEHVLHSLRKRHVLFEKCIQTVLRALVLCLYIKPQHLLFDQQISVTQGEFSNAQKHLVTIVVMLPL